MAQKLWFGNGNLWNFGLHCRYRVSSYALFHSSMHISVIIGIEIAKKGLHCSRLKKKEFDGTGVDDKLVT